MKILFIGPFRTKMFNQKYADSHFSGLGGQRKKQMVLQSLLQGGHEVRLLSTAITHQSFWGWQAVPSHTETFPNGDIQVDHASTIGLKPFSGLLSCLTSWKLGSRVREQYDADVILIYNGTLTETLALIGYLGGRDLPVALELDDLPLARKRGLNPKPYLDVWSFPQAVRRSKAFILVNKDLQVALKDAVGECLVLPGVIDPELIRCAAGRTPPFSKSEKILFNCSNLSVDRGSDLLLDLIPVLPLGWKLRVAGSGPLHDAFAQAAAQYPDKCEFLGFLQPEQLFPHLASADCVINTPEKLTRKDSVFPFKIFEYIMSGAHIISTALPSVGDLEIAWFQRWNGSVSQLPDILNQAESDFRNETTRREALTRDVRNRFSVDGVSSQLNGLLGRMLK